ncbi:MAG: peptidylprolyl isomerase [Acidobacteriota bacterium]
MIQRFSMSRACEWVALFSIGAFLGSCGAAPAPRETAADAVATWQGGAISLSELESAFAEARGRACRKARRSGGVEELVTCYNELAETRAIEQLILAEVDDVDAALAELQGYRSLRRLAYVDVFLRQERDAIEIEDAEIVRQFEADPERFRRPATLQLSNIFRRHEDPQQPEATLEALRQLKARFEAGETFEALAREASHSETRLRGGLVGQVEQGDLPARLDEAAFALEEGEVSEPILVRDGAVLLQVRHVAAGFEPVLDQARGILRRELVTHQLERLVSQRVADREPPTGSVVLELDELVEALDRGDPDHTVLDIDGDRMNASELRTVAGLGSGAAAELDAEGRDRLAELYFRQKEERLLALELVENADSDQAEAAELTLRTQAVVQLVAERLQAALEAVVAEDEEALREYFDDNSHHYQSALRFDLEVLSVPFGDDPPSQLRRLEALRERLVAGESDLAAAAADLGGTIEALKWREFNELSGNIPNKARAYLMEAGAERFGVPYQQDDALHLIELLGRNEPAPLEYEAAAEQVRADYLERFGQELYRQHVEQRLAAVDYRFDEAALRAMLNEAAGTISDPPPAGAAAAADATAP